MARKRGRFELTSRMPPQSLFYCTFIVLRTHRRREGRAAAFFGRRPSSYRSYNSQDPVEFSVHEKMRR